MLTRNEVSRDEVLLSVEGPLDGEPANEFQAQLEELTEGSYRTITLDLTKVASINSSSIGRILLCRKRLAEQGRTIRIDGCSDSLYSTFELIKFDKLIPIKR